VRVPAAQLADSGSHGVQLCVQLRTAGLRLSQLSEKWIFGVRVRLARRFNGVIRHVPAKELAEESHFGWTLARFLSTEGDLIAEHR
jgi:hypothetical protein